MYNENLHIRTNNRNRRFHGKIPCGRKKLKEEGHVVYNPAHANSYMPEGTTHEEYMKISFTLLEMADTIYMLKGWHQSRGANQEYGYALAKGYKVMEE